MLAADGAALGVVAPAGKALAVLVDEAGEGVGKSRVLVEVPLGRVIRVRGAGQVTVAAIAVGNLFAAGCGDTCQPALRVVREREAAPEIVSHALQGARAVCH